MRLIVATCSIRYEGRLVTTLASGDRVIICKADGSVVVHSGQAGAKPVNYMPGPTVIDEDDGSIEVRNPSTGERLEIALEQVLSDSAFEVTDEAKLKREGQEKDIQATIFASPEAVEDGLQGLEREMFTDVGPVDLLCRDAHGATVVIEVKRVRATAAAVEQLTRYVDQVNRNPGHAPARGMLIAPELAPQARVLLNDRGFEYVNLDEVLERCIDEVDLMTLF